MNTKPRKPINQDRTVFCHACGFNAANAEQAKAMKQGNEEREVVNRALDRAAKLTSDLEGDRNFLVALLARAAITLGVSLRIDADAVDAVMRDPRNAPGLNIEKHPKLIASPHNLDAMDYVITVRHYEPEEEARPVGNVAETPEAPALQLITGGGDA